MNLGIVGTGNLGSTLIEGIYYSDTPRTNVFAYDQVREKLTNLSIKYPNLNVCDKMGDVVAQSSILILALPLSSIQNLSSTELNLMRDRQPLVLATCGYAPMDLLERHLPTKVAKAYPNINWAIRKGVTLVHFGGRVNTQDKDKILRFLEVLGAVYEVSEVHLRPLANIASCGPALWIEMIQLFIQANAEKYGIEHKMGLELARRTIEGTFRLMEEKSCTLKQVMDLVASPGGTTGVGLKCLERFLPSVFKNTVEEISVRDKERMEKCQRAIHL